MKRIFIAIGVLIFSFGVSAVELGFIGAKADSFESLIELSDKYMMKSNFVDAVKICKKTEQLWDNNAQNIDMLLIHDYVDEIGNSISKMRTYAENNSTDLYFAESTSAKKELASIKESEFPYFENIL